MKVFFDTEFTGLHQNTKLISIGLVSEDNQTFYAENCSFQDGFIGKDDSEWASKNILPHLKFYGKNTRAYNNSMIDTCPNGASEVFGEDFLIRDCLSDWLSRFKSVELWSDCLAYDFVLFNQLWGHAFKIPSNVYYIPFDICTMFKLLEIDPGINREEFAGMLCGAEKHNALWDARVIMACYLRMERVWEELPLAYYNRSIKKEK